MVGLIELDEESILVHRAQRDMLYLLLVVSKRLAPAGHGVQSLPLQLSSPLSDQGRDLNPLARNIPENTL